MKRCGQALVVYSTIKYSTSFSDDKNSVHLTHIATIAIAIVINLLTFFVCVCCYNCFHLCVMYKTFNVCDDKPYRVHMCLASVILGTAKYM